MEYFETIMIYDGRMTEEGYKATVDHYIKKITALGGLIRDTDRMGKKKLAYAYERDKTKIGEGWYALFTFKGNPKIIPELESTMRAEDTVLKFLTVKREPFEIETKETQDKPAEESEQPAIIIDAEDVLFGLAKYN